MREKKIRKVLHERPLIRIGKAGITEGLLSEVGRQLRIKGLVKVKVLRSFMRSYNRGAEDVAAEVARATRAEVIDVRGHVFVLRRVKKAG
ncbi:MAG: RNA-binding protein [Desulfurococcales archaeon ex4484_204]|nr:MAG: RNA-binding protein [Desulfurococcales archaeon ex4484_204]